MGWSLSDRPEKQPVYTGTRSNGNQLRKQKSKKSAKKGPQSDPPAIQANQRLSVQQWHLFLPIVLEGGVLVWACQIMWGRVPVEQGTSGIKARLRQTGSKTDQRTRANRSLSSPDSRGRTSRHSHFVEALTKCIIHWEFAYFSETG